jgi:MAF protein
MTKPTKLVLASQSPRRRELLSLFGFEFEVYPTLVDETPLPGELPRDYVARLAVLKARYVSENIKSDKIVIAADTTVVDGNQILGKPESAQEAEAMLRKLRNRVHFVYTGIAIARNGQYHPDVCGSKVPIRNYTDEEMKSYIDSGDPFDKAGGYAIQNSSFNPVENFQECYANVMGLPLCHLTRTFRKLNVKLTTNIPKACQNHINYQCPVYNQILREEI